MSDTTTAKDTTKVDEKPVEQVEKQEEDTTHEEPTQEKNVDTGVDEPQVDNDEHGNANNDDDGDGTEKDAKEPSQEEILEQVQQRMTQLTDGDKKPERVVVPLSKEGRNAKTTEDAKKAAPVKVATSKADVQMEGDMDKAEFQKMQAMLGAAKSKDSKVYANISGKEETLEPGSFSPRATLIFANCKDCKFVVNNLCTKVFIQGCQNIDVEFKSKIVTHSVEVYKTDTLNARFHVKVGTMQLDMSRNLSFSFAKTQHFGNAIWAGCYNLSLGFDDSEHAITTGYDLMEKEYADLNEERSQFKLHVLKNNLLSEKVIRLPNGFPTTKREKDAFEARQERNMKLLAKEMGFVVPNKKREDAKVGRNDPCPCGSTRKYKKCCGQDINKNE